jgi:hypothetical protein
MDDEQPRRALRNARHVIGTIRFVLAYEVSPDIKHTYCDNAWLALISRGLLSGGTRSSSPATEIAAYCYCLLTEWVCEDDTPFVVRAVMLEKASHMGLVWSETASATEIEAILLACHSGKMSERELAAWIKIRLPPNDLHRGDHFFSAPTHGRPRRGQCCWPRRHASTSQAFTPRDLIRDRVA